MDRRDPLTGKYQDALRVIGAWLDIRGFSDVRIREDAGELVIEAAGTSDNPPAVVERFRLDLDSIELLSCAARKDRGSALSRHSIVELPRSVGRT
jgi:hypothetical protein